SSSLPAIPAAALATAATAGTAASAPTLAAGALEQALLTVVADKTGYPVDMLELDMRLDADLGIDSIKRVEILSALQEQLPQLPAVAPDELGRLETLRQIVNSLSSNLPAAPAAALATAATAGTAASATTLAAGALEQALLTVVADKTGYPVDMLELDMRLDADLGIDSIKRVEILSALQEQLPQLPAVAPDELGRLETLRQIVSALAPAALTTDSTRQGQALPLSSCATPASCRCASKGSCADPATCHCTSSTAGAAELAQAGLHRQRIRLVPLPAAPPRPLINDAPFWIVDDCSPLSTALAEALRQQGLVAEIVGPQQHNPPARLAGLLVPAPAVGSDSLFLQQTFELLQRCAPALQNAASGGRKALFVTLARLDGRFGFDPAGTPLADPLSGGLAGLSKTAGHEWPNVCCQAYDLAAELQLAQQVEALVAQLQQQGPAEIGLTAAGPVTLQLETTPLPQPAQPLRFSSDEVIIVSGGARGVTAEVACQLAAAGQPTLLLLGRSPLPQAEDAELAAASDEAAIKRLLLARTPDKPNPRALQQACQQVLAARELRANLARMTASGARVLYRALDIRDEAAVAAAVAEARACGRIRGLIHGAGVLADKRIEDKTAEQFAAVYSTKVAGLLALLQATADDALDFIALFSSSTGRFGRTGQCDYAVANEVLNKSAQAIARQRPDCRVLALNWGPWDGGMVTPALKQLFAGEGIEVIDLRQGAAYLLAELADSRRNEVELVLLGGGPPAASAGGDHTGPADTATSEAPTAPLLAQPLYELTVASRRMAVLRDHVLAGRAVLPTALHLEWLAQAALHSQPGLQLLAIDNLCICSGLKLAADDSAQLQLRGGSPAQTAEGLRLPLQLCDAASGQLYSRAEALLADRLAAAPEPLAALALDPASGGDAARYYRNGQLFHGPLLQGLRQIIGSSASGIEALCQTAPAPANWLDAPLRSSWLTEPLLVDGAFQLLILWTQAQHGRACLPAAIGRYRSFVEEFPAGLGRLRCRIDRLQGNQLNATIDLLDEAGQRVLARLEQVQATLAELTAAFAANRLQA
ncbi:MAG: SDR family NAD(P)-dependent oxidoreductase, partial [Desulfuromonas sp.]